MADPYASVVVLTTQENPRVLQDLKKQTFKDFEVILATEPGIVNAMNLALDKAKGEIFVRIDDDVELHPNWLFGLLNDFKWDRVAGATGPTFVPKERRQYRDSIRYAENPKGFLKWLYDGNAFSPGCFRTCGCVSYDSNFKERFNVPGWFWSYHTPDYLEGTNWAMRTELIRHVGGFDPKFDGVSEWFDNDVEQKIIKKGYILKYNTDAYLYHMLEKSPQHGDRYNWPGRVKNWLRFHWRHGKFHPKMIVYLIVWIGYFMTRKK